MNINETIISNIASNFNKQPKFINAVIELLKEGATIPFIARYRKEVTNAMTEEEIREIDKEYQYQVSLAERKEDVVRLIEEKGKLTDELRTDIMKCTKLSELEDIYRPYKEKKKTRATEAKKNGLEPLADWILSYPRTGDLELEAKKYINDAIKTTSAAIQGAKDIIAEMVSDNAEFRKYIRENFERSAKISTSKKKDAQDEKGVFQMYYEYEEPIKNIQDHRILAVNRGEDEKVLTVSLKENTEQILNHMYRNFIKYQNSFLAPTLMDAINDAYKRLIKPSIEREIRAQLTERAEEASIVLFGENLKQLLLQPPLKGKVVLGVDPAFRTGCKMAVVDTYGKFTDMTVIYPHQKFVDEKIPASRIEEAKKKITDIINKHKVDIVAIGNGTASRETEKFVVDVLKNIKHEIYYIIVSEAGASVYSASKLAIEEFPTLAVEERSAISIARRLQDPLSELVKIDPKSIGVGQYQHDVNQKNLEESLSFVVSTAVNKVGVNINTASSALIQYVSGISKTVAENIVKYREENGAFKTRSEIKKVPKLGPKVFEQSAGFFRILDGTNKLDSTGIHPESYKEAEAILAAMGLKKTDIGSDLLKERIASLDKQAILEQTGLGKHTLNDILDALVSPQRDPREELDKPLLRQDVLKLEDIKIGDQLIGTIRNITDFGAFVDCGFKEAGLVHKSKLSKKFIKHPMDVVSVGDIVTVYVTELDLNRGRLGLSMFEQNK